MPVMHYSTNRCKHGSMKGNDLALTRPLKLVYIKLDVIYFVVMFEYCAGLTLVITAPANFNAV